MKKYKLDDLFKKLVLWYGEQCDGDWEHSYGIKIETLDNPGWLVKIDLSETEFSSLNIERVVVEKDANDWFQYEFKDQTFTGCGGVNNFYEILNSFFNHIES